MRHDDSLAVARAEALGALLQLVGYAVWQVAECEDALAHWVAIAARETRGIGEAAAEPIVAKVQRKTFGQLLNEIRDADVLDAGLVDRVQALVRSRNWLVHHAKRENRGVVNDMARYDRLAARLGEIAEEATKLQSELGRELEEYIVRAGVDRTAVDAEAARLQREWGYAE